MFKTLTVAARDRARLAEIINVASRLGLGLLLAQLGIEPKGKGGQQDFEGADLPRRVRMALEALGPTFVKLGQILATRADLLPPHWIAELEALHSQAPMIAFDDLRPSVEAALGAPPEEVFASFDETPLAAASIAQVHRATLEDGTAVVLKIRRPGIRPPVEADLRLVSQLAALAETSNPQVRRFHPVALARQLADAMLSELDFTQEGRNAEMIRDDFAGEPQVIIPEIHWQWTSESLLVMDYVEGSPPRDGDMLRAEGIDPAAIAALGADMVLDMVLINGRFHADPHPGNLLCLPGNRIALLDFGMIGHVSPRRREEFLSFLLSLTSGDPAALADTLAIWSQDGNVPRERVMLVAERLVARHSGGRIILSAMMTDFLAVLRDEELSLPPDLLLILKALITMDGVLSRIEPDFDLQAAMQRSWLRVARARLSPGRWEPLLRSLVLELARIGDDAPRLLRALTRRIEGEAIAAPSLQPDIRGAARLIASAIVAGALIIALALLGR
ncbi:ABC1 kinase family protein [Sphingobium quisquiliarum]|nr:AarF/UbiB family protein [Sphingobium quisquiliarum]